MSSACGCEHEPVTEIDELDRPWWKDPELLLPIFSGVALITGLALDWSDLETPATVLYWVGLLLGAYTFAPGAIRNLVTKRKLGIGLLMTISAVGAVILGVGYGIYLAVDFALITQVLPRAGDRERDLGVINIANALPQVLAPALAGPIITWSARHGTHADGYRTLYLLAAAIGVAAALLIRKIRSVD
mgnify:CR=1 FL=1